MGRPIDPTTEPQVDGEFERALRGLSRDLIWPYKTDRATAGTTSEDAIDDSPQSRRRAALYEGFRAERERLGGLGLPLAEQLAAAADWAEAHGFDAAARRARSHLTVTDKKTKRRNK